MKKLRDDRGLVPIVRGQVLSAFDSCRLMFPYSSVQKLAAHLLNPYLFMLRFYDKAAERRKL